MTDDVRLNRIILEETSGDGFVIRVDLLMMGEKVKQKIEYLGLWIDRSGGELAPFVLRSDGNVDFGSSYNGDDRFYNSNLLKKEVRIGQQFTFESGGEETVYKVTQIERLL